MHPIDRHNNVVFQFSGGKDSIACLEELRPFWGKMTVLWLNPGNPLPELSEQMEKVKAAVPNFVEVKTDSAGYIGRHGLPVDVLPIRNHQETQFLAGQKRIPLQSFMACCAENIMLPMQNATMAMGATLVIRGQKLADGHKSPVRSGDVILGVEYFFPIENWSNQDVLERIQDSEFLPRNYVDGNTSLECWHCTAYAEEHRARRAYLAQHHPEKAEEVKAKTIIIRNEILKDLQHME